VKALVGLVAIAISTVATAQDYPSKPIRILVPFAPGGVVDTSTRILTLKMSERLGWNFVIENRPGGNGFIASPRRRWRSRRPTAIRS
jgi:tripartite-type tricarboxylate transporter receptor subunit TctC